MVINISKVLLIVFLLIIAYQFVEEDRCFCRTSGFSPQSFGARHYTTFKQIHTLYHGYYEYEMDAYDFHHMLKALNATGNWKIETRCMFYFPQFTYSDSMDCDWFFLMKKTSSTIWMAYDERKGILYAGYFET